MTHEEMARFVRQRTAPAPVPLVPELSLHQATELTPLWHATAAELERSDPAPFWAFPWAGGQALARYVLDHAEVVRGRAVVDLGTGSGLVAIAAARAGARRVVACDHDPFCAAAVAVNAELNRVEVTFAAHDLLGPAADAGLPLLEGCEVVLAGDPFYERALAERVLAILRRCASRGARALAGDPGRIYSPRAGVVEVAVHDVPTSPEIERAAVLRTRVVEATPEPPCPRSP